MISRNDFLNFVSSLSSSILSFLESFSRVNSLLKLPVLVHLNLTGNFFFIEINLFLIELERKHWKEKGKSGEIVSGKKPIF